MVNSLLTKRFQSASKRIVSLRITAWIVAQALAGRAAGYEGAAPRPGCTTATKFPNRGPCPGRGLGRAGLAEAFAANPQPAEATSCYRPYDAGTDDNSCSAASRGKSPVSPLRSTHAAGANATVPVPTNLPMGYVSSHRDARAGRAIADKPHPA